MNFLSVGLGGALGSMLRYGLSLFTIKMEFPAITFLTNFAGALIIGFIAGAVSIGKSPSSSLLLFWKTGFCGGFTTFSTFSLETVTLLENRHYGTGLFYIGASLLLCLAGVCIGNVLAKTLLLH